MSNSAFNQSSGTVTAVSVASSNGFAGSSSGGATPALTLTTTITGILQGNGTAISAATTTGSGNVVLATSPTLTTPIIGAAAGTSLSLSGLTASSAVATDGSKNLVSVTNTGTGNNVLATSPSFTTPVLGAASATSINFGGNSLANYVEGTFTPTVYGLTTAGTTTYTTRVGEYTRVGNRVDFCLNLGWSNQTGTGLLQIGGLPLTAGTAVSTACGVLNNGLAVGANAQLQAVVTANTTVVDLYATTPTAGAIAGVPVDTSVTLLYISGTYFL